MTEIKNTTKKAMGIMDDLMRQGERDIYAAYGKPSSAKVAAFYEIAERARNTEGYNYDLHIVGAGSHFFSTVYSYTESDGTLCIVKDTACNTFLVRVPAETQENTADTQETDTTENIA